MAGEEPYTPASAGPEPVEAATQAPDAAAVPAPDPGPQPTATVGASSASFGQPAGSAALGGGPAEDPHPEKLVGAAFAGGLVTALVLKGLARRKHA
jgi:hypothetical protein